MHFVYLSVCLSIYLPVSKYLSMHTLTLEQLIKNKHCCLNASTSSIKNNISLQKKTFSHYADMASVSSALRVHLHISQQGNTEVMIGYAVHNTTFLYLQTRHASL